MSKTRKLTLTSIIIAITTLTSNIVFIPVGFAKIFPVQHMANVLTAVLLGPVYSVAQSFIVSLLRNMSGTGSIFAFPGSMIGAFLAGFLFFKTKKLIWAFIGEITGTGILGALAAYPIATLLLGNKVALFGFVPSFIISSLGGAIIGMVFIKILFKNKIIGGIIYENSSYNRRL
ncbi:energy coupling factor transporter S component ThiW [Heyndrickxia oleronia]|uniref:energy coupling factor transporter S component ThiW n=1 Tax=Heyndrickxia oleronia TaxID=38875 RepID=UPI001B26AB16|nr:energy coupling factor transporter S component ThiW [Heyndrickxia oleronia]GIN37060.1 energy coupling factor transporter S component ThiW [Heyndrickxia oleronia]